jgi:hypothetical protein
VPDIARVETEYTAPVLTKVPVWKATVFLIFSKLLAQYVAYSLFLFTITVHTRTIHKNNFSVNYNEI